MALPRLAGGIPRARDGTQAGTDEGVAEQSVVRREIGNRRAGDERDGGGGGAGARDRFLYCRYGWIASLNTPTGWAPRILRPFTMNVGVASTLSRLASR